MKKDLLFSCVVILSAAVLAAAYPPVDQGILAWVALSPLLFVLRKAGSIKAAGFGLLFGMVFVSGVFYWIPGLAAISWLNFFIWLLVFSLYFTGFGFFYSIISNRTGCWIIIGGPALWVVMEYIRSNFFFLAWPWGLLGHSQYQYLPVIQIANITGVYGISFLVLLVNQFLSLVPDMTLVERELDKSWFVYRQRMISMMLATLFIFSLFIAYGYYSRNLSHGEKTLRVALIQGNQTVKDRMPFEAQRDYLDAYGQLSRTACRLKPDLIVWPASSLPAPIETSRLVRHRIRRLVKEEHVFLLAGGAGSEKMKPKDKAGPVYSNSEFLISPSGRLKGRYNKMRLLPFNEYLPLQEIIQWPVWLTTLKHSFAPGRDFFLFNVQGAKFGTPICWENMFSNLFRQFVKKGANIMVSVTNEEFMCRSAAPYQTLAATVFRAVENRVAIARCASTGISAFILPDGEIVERVRDSGKKDLFVKGWVVRDVPISEKKTFYTLFGDIFAFCNIGLVMILLFYTPISRRITRQKIRE